MSGLKLHSFPARCECQSASAPCMESSVRQIPDPRVHVLVTRVRVYDGRERRRMLRKPLREEQVPRRPIHVHHRAVPQLVEPVLPIEPRPPLPPRESPLGGAGRESTTLRGHEQRIVLSTSRPDVEKLEVSREVAERVWDEPTDPFLEEHVVPLEVERDHAAVGEGEVLSLPVDRLPFPRI